jgi:hypothetical protein
MLLVLQSRSSCISNRRGICVDYKYAICFKITASFKMAAIFLPKITVRARNENSGDIYSLVWQPTSTPSLVQNGAKISLKLEKLEKTQHLTYFLTLTFNLQKNFFYVFLHSLWLILPNFEAKYELWFFVKFDLSEVIWGHQEVKSPK